ncbi:integrase [Escherichia coli]|uniref:Integrase n=1 Tax=Escherichia coli TaxID=562 RepID=A0A376KWQ8_ECOLX|nr:integrase [Escherichia coli]
MIYPDEWLQHMVFVQHSGTGVANRDIRGIWRERALAHTLKNKVEAAYHRTDLLDQRIPMMQAWADYVMSQIMENQR